MPTLVLDACAALHAKQLGGPSGGPLDLLSEVAARGVRLLSSRAVHGEMVSCSLSAQVEAWEQASVFESRGVSVRRVRSVALGHKRGMQRPGRNDMGLIALAIDEDAPLLTHDRALAQLALALGVLTIDLLDLGAFVAGRGWRPWNDVEVWLASFHAFAWRPEDLDAAGARATVDARPKWPATFERLCAWC